MQGLDFFAEVPTLDDQMPPTRGAGNAVAVLVLRDMQGSPARQSAGWSDYAKSLKAEGGMLILADVNAEVMAPLKKSGTLEVIGAENIFPATSRVLGAGGDRLGGYAGLVGVSMTRSGCCNYPRRFCTVVSFHRLME